MPQDENGVWDNEQEAQANGGGAWWPPGHPNHVAPVDNTGRDIEQGFAEFGRGLEDFFTNSDEIRAAEEAEDWRRSQWNDLEDRAPTLDDLTADYRGEGRTDAYGDLLGGQSRLEGMTQENQQAALDAMGGLMEGGLTEADKAAIHSQRLQSGQRLGAANQAAIQQMSARGMGGSGAELASRMGGSQAMANANAMGDASVLGQASNRAFAAMQGYGQLSGQMFDQESRRRANLDSWNQQGLDWRRGRESRNTDIYNQGQDQRVGAHQQQFENDTTTTGGKTNQNFQNIQHQQGREDEEEDRLWRIGAAIVD